MAALNTTGTPYRVAVIADKDVIYGLARVYEAFRDANPGEIRTFRAREEAEAWLGLPRG
jgi:hypothetical protein